MNGGRTTETPVWTAEAVSRLLGACDGYIHAVAAIRLKIGQMQYRPIPDRNVQQKRRREELLSPLREIEVGLVSGLRSCQEAYKRESARLALSQERNDG